MLKTERGSFLIGNGMDSADELISALKGKIERGKSLATASNTKLNSDVKKRITMDFRPDGNKTIAAEDDAQETSQTDSSTRNSIEDRLSGHEPELLDGTTDDTNETDPDNETTQVDVPVKTLPSGKKADRRFRRKKKNKPS